RFDLIIEGFEIFSKQPLFGHGLENYRFLNSHETYAHNNYIELLVSVGVLGFLSYYLVLAYKMIFIFKRRKLYDMHLFGSLLLIVLILDIAQVSYKNQITQTILVIVFSYCAIFKQNVLDSNDLNITNKKNLIEVHNE